MTSSKKHQPPPPRTKIAILGGGPGSLSAAYYLTTLEPERYDITVYEMSWRLGGKTASGRDQNGRIEEHGLHVLFGGYHNAFDMMLGCYDAVRAECGPDTLAFPSFFDALQPGDFGVIGDDRYQKWRQVDMQFPVNRGVPGDPPLPTTWDVLSGVFQVLLHVLVGARALRWFQRLWGRLVGYKRRMPRGGRPRARQVAGDGGDWVVRKVFIGGALSLLDGERWPGRICQALSRAAHWVVRAVGPVARARFIRDRFVGRVWTFLDLTLASWIGLSKDRVLFRPDGYQRLDQVDLRIWLKRHHAHWHTRYSPLVRIIYDAAFSYPEGGKRVDQGGFLRERMAAGAALRIMIWMAFTYKGAMYYKMRAGMGDVIHTPLYRLLEKRGVKFRFFHKVKGLEPGLAPDGTTVVRAVELQELARPLPESDGGEAGGYQPLVRVGEMDCWPSQPVLDRIHPDDRESALRAEEFFFEPQSPRPVRLEHGRDFDKVIFGIPVGCIPYLCKDLAEHGNWGKQHKVESTQTVAFQMWSKLPLDKCGWKDPAPLLSLFWDPLNTWSDMGQVLDRENWPEDQRPSMLAYFCGPLPHEWPVPEAERVDPFRDRRFKLAVEGQAEQARDRLLQYLHQLWPEAGTPPAGGLPGVFNWNILYDPQNRKGRARLDGQYLRANFDPHARCTLALPRQSGNRIAPDATGFANMTVAGDWTANEVLVACFEGTVQSGIRAARAISGDKALYRIIGEDLLNPGASFGRRESVTLIDPPRLPRLPRRRRRRGPDAPAPLETPGARPEPRMKTGEMYVGDVVLTPPPEIIAGRKG